MPSDDCPSFSHPPPLPTGEVHVWQAPLDRDAAVVSHLDSLLDDDERDRARRFHFPKDQGHFSVGRGLLRCLLGEYLRIAPAAVRLSYTSAGKPHVVGETGDTAIEFNVAHSDGLVVFAVTRGRALGVDVERVRPGVEWRELAGRYFAPPEVAELTALPSDCQERAFFTGWTRKEAYLKALGLGMAIPLDQFAVSLTPNRPPALLATAHDPSQRDRWDLHEFTPAADYVGALAVEGRAGRILYGRWQPLG
jgi:4'-phosphopantetheinyl transferase